MTTALEEGEGSASRPGRSLPPGKSRYPLYKKLGGPQDRSGQVRNILPPTGFRTQIAQPVASRYTDYDTHPIKSKEKSSLNFPCQWAILEDDVDLYSVYPKWHTQAQFSGQWETQTEVGD
jgi:hypothetical protein